MVILHVVAPLPWGGLERVVQALARGFCGLGHEVHVAAIGERLSADHPFCAPLQDTGVQVHRIDVPARGYLRERNAIADLCHRLRPDVVHTHGYHPDVVDGSIARRQGIPIVTTLHGFTHGGWRNACYEWIQYRAFRRFDAVVAVARALVTRLERAGVPPGRIHEVPNAWWTSAPRLERAAARTALGLPADAFVLGWVGRLGPEKGPDVLIDALPHLTDLPLVLSVIGAGVQRAPLEARTGRLGPGTQVRWHGAIPEADCLFTAFDAFVLSSRAEGTPIVLLAAMAAGVPIVATSVGGVPDVVSPAEAALVGPDDPAALAAAIRGVYHDRQGAARRARAARVRVEREFGVAPWLERYEAIYHQVARGVRAPALS